MGGECGVGVVSDFSSDYTMLGSSSAAAANNRYQLQHPSANAAGSPASVADLHYSTGGNLQQQQHQNNGLVPTTSISSGQLFHTHHGIGHFTSPAATYIPTG